MNRYRDSIGKIVEGLGELSRKTLSKEDLNRLEQAIQAYHGEFPYLKRLEVSGMVKWYLGKLPAIHFLNITWIP